MTIIFLYRLSIIRLERGRQPLSYENERYWTIFNGEIYNYLELKEGLINQGYTFKTESDMEVILTLYNAMKNKAAKISRQLFIFMICIRYTLKAFITSITFTEKNWL